ncbi:hypothetical protein [Cypionkella sp. TWP1-2-1b2]|uniref:hypothetical protein n=1 Tax=Cypionkella sp. TWP1-2-1b2 TaxID=2804675 RepID=UPI003CEE4C85
MTDIPGSSDVERVVAMRTERNALCTIVIIFLLPFFVLAFVGFSPINDDIIIGHATALTNMVPGLSKSFLNIQQYSSTLNSAEFVIIYFWSFTSVCTISMILVFAFGFTEKFRKIENNGNKNQAVRVSVPRDPRKMIGPAWLCCTNQPEVEFSLPLDRVIRHVEFAAFQVP